MFLKHASSSWSNPIRYVLSSLHLLGGGTEQLGIYSYKNTAMMRTRADVEFLIV